MRLWLLYAIGAFLCWGCYVPTIHAGQLAIGGKYKGLWAFLLVGAAYVVTAMVIPIAILAANRADPAAVTWPSTRGVSISFLAGVLGAAGALCVILALMNGGTPFSVPPLVFAGAPIVASLVAIGLHPPRSVDVRYFLGIGLAAAGAALVLRYKPS